MVKAYERLPDEPLKAYEYFQAYISLGKIRSNDKTAKLIGKSVQLMDKYSSKYNWVERVRQWDNEQSLVILDKLKELAKQKNLEHLEYSQKLIDLALARIAKIDLKKFRKSEIPIYEARLLLTAGIQLQRDALGIADQVKIDLSNNGKAITGVTVTIRPARKRPDEDSGKP